MNPNQILSADLLDLVFSDRNKEYGAYDLRKSYDRRIKKALGITSLVLLLGIGGHLMAGTGSKDVTKGILSKEVKLSDIPIPDKVEPPPPPPPPPVEQPPVRTLQFTTPIIVDETDQPPPTIDDIEDARIDVKTTEGIDDPGIVAPSTIDAGTRVIEQQVVKEPEIFTSVEVAANYKGDWRKFLERNLRGDIPVENGAAPGSYTVVVQFVVDIDGSVSDIRALSNMGYGMEQEAIRVLKKADKWEPGIQNGRAVKSYRRQPITFKIDE